MFSEEQEDFLNFLAHYLSNVYTTFMVILMFVETMSGLRLLAQLKLAWVYDGKLIPLHGPSTVNGVVNNRPEFCHSPFPDCVCGVII